MKGEPGMYIELVERRRRLLRNAELRGDALARATLRPSKPWTPEPTDYPVTRLPSVWRDVRWGAAA